MVWPSREGETRCIRHFVAARKHLHSATTEGGCIAPVCLTIGILAGYHIQGALNTLKHSQLKSNVDWVSDRVSVQCIFPFPG